MNGNDENSVSSKFDELLSIYSKKDLKKYLQLEKIEIEKTIRDNNDKIRNLEIDRNELFTILGIIISLFLSNLVSEYFPIDVSAFEKLPQLATIIYVIIYIVIMSLPILAILGVELFIYEKFSKKKNQKKIDAMTKKNDDLYIMLMVIESRITEVN